MSERKAGTPTDQWQQWPYSEGQDAAYHGQSSMDCPYLHDPSDGRFDAWMEGYRDVKARVAMRKAKH